MNRVSFTRPAQACELLHDIRSEGPIDVTVPISLQRSLLVRRPAFLKPVMGGAF